MICKSDIKSNLDQLNALYLDARANRKRQFYSKLAVLELCGWLEEVLDKIVLAYCDKKLNETCNIEEFKQNVEGTFGFDYKKNFRPLIIKLVGFKGLERFEASVGQPDIVKFKSLLGTLKSLRDTQAHTHVKGVLKNITSPSIVINNLDHIHPILKIIDKQFRRL